MADAAERIVLSVPAGERESHRLVWVDKEGRSANSHLGSLHWSVHVHSEQTVDLEVSCELRPQTDGGEPTLVLLQEVMRDKKFLGTFEPATDSRLVEARGGAEAVGEGVDLCAEIEAIVFEFSAGFSWFNGKEIELILVRHRPPVQLRSEVPPLPPLEPLTAPPRCIEAKMLEGGVGRPPPELRKLPVASSGLPEGAAGDVVRFARHLDVLLEAWLESAEAKCPRKDLAAECGVGGAWFEQLEDQVGELRGLLQRGPYPLNGGAPQANGEVSAEESGDLHVGAAQPFPEDRGAECDAVALDAALLDSELTNAELPEAEAPDAKAPEAEVPEAPEAQGREAEVPAMVTADQDEAASEAKVEAGVGIENTAEIALEVEAQGGAEAQAVAEAKVETGVEVETTEEAEVEEEVQAEALDTPMSHSDSTLAAFEPASEEDEPANRLDEVSEGSEGEAET